jgi:hypothetical protein
MGSTLAGQGAQKQIFVDKLNGELWASERTIYELLFRREFWAE